MPVALPDQNAAAFGTRSRQRSSPDRSYWTTCPAAATSGPSTQPTARNQPTSRWVSSRGSIRTRRSSTAAHPAYTSVVHPARDTASTQRASGVTPTTFASTSVTSSTGVYRSPSPSSNAKLNPDGGYHSDTCRPAWNTEDTAARLTHTPT